MLFINLNSYAEDQVSIVLDISPTMLPKISNQLDGYTDIIEQMTDKLKQAKVWRKPVQIPNFFIKHKAIKFSIPLRKYWIIIFKDRRSS